MNKYFIMREYHQLTKQMRRDVSVDETFNYSVQLSSRQLGLV